MKEKESDSADGEREKKGLFEVEGALLHYTREVGNIMTTIFSHKLHQLNVCEEAVHSWTKESSHTGVLSFVNVEVHGKVSKKNP